MILSTLAIVDWLLYLLFFSQVAYLLLFAIASKFSRPARYPDCAPGRFCVLFPAYKEDRVIEQAVRSFLKQDYPRELYDVVVISDQMQPTTNDRLNTLPIIVLQANYAHSSKAKALTLAVDRTVHRHYDAYIIMDADNLTTPDFLHEMNRAFGSGLKAVQAHRVAKNLNTDIALLDAVSEEINNAIFRSGHTVLGLSSALIGSGMGIDADWFARHVKRLHTAGEDKEIEALLLQQGIHIGYLDHVPVADEKTRQRATISNQRKRWLAAQFGSLRAGLPHLPAALLKGNIDYVDKMLQWMLLPRIVLLAAILLLSTLTTLCSVPSGIKWWVLSGVLVVTLAVAIPRKLLNARLLKALVQLPWLALMMVSNLFKLRGVNKRFIHTQHGEHESTEHEST